MKKILLPITIIILIVIALILSNRNSIQEITSPELADTAESQQLCFEYRGEADAGENVEKINLTIQDQKVYGTHSITPAEGASEFATVSGAAQNGYVNVIASADRGDYSWREQRVYFIGDERLFVGYQTADVPRVEDDGVFMYADINQLSFATEEFYLTQIDCSLEL